MNSRPAQVTKQMSQVARKKKNDDDDNSTSSVSTTMSLDSVSVNKNAATFSAVTTTTRGNQDNTSGHRQDQSKGSIREKIIAVSTSRANHMQGDGFSVAASSITVRTNKTDDGYVRGVQLGMDPAQLITLKDQIKRVMFPHCKIMHNQREWDDVDRGSFADILMDKCNVSVPFRVGFWNTVKVQAKRYLKSLTQQVNTKVKGVYMSKETIPTKIVENIHDSSLTFLVFFRTSTSSRSLQCRSYHHSGTCRQGGIHMVC